MQSGAIWNDFELQRICLKTRTVNGGFWRHFKRVGTADTILKPRTVNGAFWRYLERFGTAEIILTRTRSRALLWHILKRYLKLPWEETANALTSLRGARNHGSFENKNGHWCIRMLFETTIWKSKRILKIRAVNGALCRYLIRCFGLQRKCWKQ